MAKNIVICCDGTGNEFGSENSNVVNLYRTLVQDRGQVCYYHPGVGTEGSLSTRNAFQTAWATWMGLAFGQGLPERVGDAYRFLMDNYEEDDNIFMFGFSRGAYTVRSLAALISMFGLLQAGNQGLIPYVLKMYALKSRWTKGSGKVFEVATDFKSSFSREVTVHCVGVWDTVSSIGMIWDPIKLAYTARTYKMNHGRHAVSIDERRRFFSNNLWGAPFPGQTIKQIWFAGVHSDVGGSYPAAEAGLSQITLEWMLCEVVPLGLRVDRVKVAKVLGKTGQQYPVAPNLAQPIHDSLTLCWKLLEILPHGYYDAATKKKRWRIPMGARRTIPPGSVFHESVREKLHVDPTYKPKNLPEGWEQCTERAVAFEFK